MTLTVHLRAADGATYDLQVPFPWIPPRYAVTLGDKSTSTDTGANYGVDRTVNAADRSSSTDSTT